MTAANPPRSRTSSTKPASGNSSEEPVHAPWLAVVSWVALAGASASGGWIVIDVYGRGYRQRMGIMEVVWPVTSLYFGPAAGLPTGAASRARSARFSFGWRG